ncbi:phage baseplate assembly protein [Microvirga terricola]|uniref:Mu P family protein n=1 Tax=Microvirga terricola TaxID=2719797 RepID=A0ABX0V6P5_9HYPH|nr:Mu P family protein [Microvirga terricola]NIX75382.1 Mu P family protein [Microvirga terricola]
MSLYGLMGHNSLATRRVAAEIDGRVFDLWTRLAIDRDLSEICGSFQLELRDGARNLASWPYVTPGDPISPFHWGQKVKLYVDEELVLVGWIDDVNPSADEGNLGVSICGRDVVGDLVDCAASVEGPTEFKGLDLLQIAERLVKPFGLKARADVDVGPAFDRYTFDCGETVLSALEKGARQRGLLVTSDGIEGIVLTHSGKQRGADDLSFPGNVRRSDGNFSGRERFSDYYVKGQSERAGGARRKGVALDGTAEPLGAASPIQSEEKRGVTIQGHANDPEVTRYRPTVSMTRSAATAQSAQTQADWMMRTRRAKSDKLDYLYPDYRGSSGRLWRPNEISLVDDRYQVVERDLLAAGVTFLYDERGTQTRLRLTGPEAYDMDPEGDRRCNKKRRRGGGALDGTARAL